MNTPCILTNQGKYFYFEFPEEHDFHIKEVASALSKLCRFTGHCNVFYSVGQHSVLVSRNLPVNLALPGLLHDGVEAYLGDVASPLKRMLADYKRLERYVEEAFFKRYSIAFPLDPQIKVVDILALITEKRDNMTRAPDDVYGKEHSGGVHWPEGEPFAEKIRPWSPGRTRIEFLLRYAELTGIWHITPLEKWTRWIR